MTDTMTNRVSYDIGCMKSLRKLPDRVALKFMDMTDSLHVRPIRELAESRNRRGVQGQLYQVSAGRSGGTGQSLRSWPRHHVLCT